VVFQGRKVERQALEKVGGKHKSSLQERGKESSKSRNRDFLPVWRCCGGHEGKPWREIRGKFGEKRESNLEEKRSGTEEERKPEWTPVITILG